MYCWEWIILMIVFGLVSTLEAVIIISAHAAAKVQIETARRGKNESNQQQAHGPFRA